MPDRTEWGDFQTPLALARQIVGLLKITASTRVLEPTCGAGSFMQAAQCSGPAETIGVEINEAYVPAAEAYGQVLERDAFRFDFASIEWRTAGPLVVVGNPPWVTNADIGALGGVNLPDKVNLRSLKGLDALTGAANFDVAEYIWLKLILDLMPQQPTMALLCKSQVARNVLAYCEQFKLPVGRASLHLVDAKKWFGVSVDAGLLTISVGEQGSDGEYVCDLYDSLDDAEPTRRFGFVDRRLVADVDAYERSRDADGVCHLDWRQGVKHDAAGVMELRQEGGHFINRLGAEVVVESEHMFPLLKCSDLYNGALEPTKAMVVPQRSLGEDTTKLEATSPRLWAYLTSHQAALASRKSSIYRGRPPFSVFGIGDYSFAPYKVAISGLHKNARFRLVPPSDGRPVVFDDTCYMLPFDSAQAACLAYSILASDASLALIEAIAFWDSKRPITKKLLQRIDMRGIALGREGDLITAAAAALESLGLPPTHDWDKVLEDLLAAEA